MGNFKPVERGVKDESRSGYILHDNDSHGKNAPGGFSSTENKTIYLPKFDFQIFCNEVEHG